MKVYIQLEINESGIKTDKGCMQQFQTLAAAKETLREIQRAARRQGFNALFLSTSCDFLRVADHHTTGKWYFWHYTIRRQTPKKQK